MRSTRLSMAIGALVLANVGCGGSIQVRTIAEPDAVFATLQTFRILPNPERIGGRSPSGADDPMISSSIANHAIRARIAAGFDSRGYAINERSPDFVVAFYASARDKLDPTLRDYRFPEFPGSEKSPRQIPEARPYTEGSVVIDVINASTHSLMWRGEGRAVLSNDPADNVEQLAKTASAIIERFPKAVPRVVAARSRL